MLKLRVRPIVDGLYEMSAHATNVFLLARNRELLLIDTGYPGWGPSILKTIADLGYDPKNLKTILVTHSHPDHSGSLHAIQQSTLSTTIMHTDDAEMVRAGKTKRTLTPSPGLLHALIFRRFIATSPMQVDPARVDRLVSHNEVLNICGESLQVVHLPGHAKGQIALIWNREPGCVAFVADAAVNLFGLSHALASEHHDEMLRSLTKLSEYDFEVACFGHGKTIHHGAAGKFRRRWGPAS